MTESAIAPRPGWATTAAAVAVLVTVSGCASRTDTPAASAPTSAPAGATITITDFAYSADAVAPGAVVTVTNIDAAEHSVSSDAAGVFDTDVDGRGSATFIAPDTPGTYPLHCKYHSRMRGVLVVR